MFAKRCSSVATMTLFLNFYRIPPPDFSAASAFCIQEQNIVLESKVDYNTFLLNTLQWYSIAKGLDKPIN